MTKIEKWADKAMFHATPIEDRQPKVHLLWMTPDPLGAIAAACRMYEGRPTYSLSDVTDEERKFYWKQAQSTHLKAPLEFVNFHFFIEGVDRAFTHQQVRQRTAVFAQESMRFAVKNNLINETSLPPSLEGTVYTEEEGEDWDHRPEQRIAQSQRNTWDDAISHIQAAYEYLINTGMPAEEARGLLPHATLTRLNYHTNLRNLLDHAGNRLCTQAQFHWRLVFTLIAKAISEYKVMYRDIVISDPDKWQFQELSQVFRPVCYDMGKCPFKADFDRGCTIRSRVDDNAAVGRPSSEWHLPMFHDGQEEQGAQPEIWDIQPQEWAMDPTAGFVR